MHRLVSVRELRIALFALVAAVSLTLTFAAPRPAEAAVWCAGDPTILVNGNAVSVTVHIPADRLRDLDYAEVVFHVPSNADVKLLVNDSLIPMKTRFVKDQAPTRGGLLSSTSIPVEVVAHHRGAPMPIAATTLALGRGTSLWTQGTSDQPLWIRTTGLLNLRLF